MGLFYFLRHFYYFHYFHCFHYFYYFHYFIIFNIFLLFLVGGAQFAERFVCGGFYFKTFLNYAK